MAVRISRKQVRWLIALACIALLATGGWFGWKHWLKPWLFPPSPLVITPQIALESLQAKNLYFNGLALPWLLKQRPELLTEDEKKENSATVRSFTQATQNPKLFRQLDRQTRFDTLLLLDDPSNYQRLIDHLLEPEVAQRDFRLVYLDHWAVVFKRGAEREWEPKDAEPLREKLANLHSEDRAAFLAKTAARMLAVYKPEPAKKWLDEAIAADGDSIDALSGLAAYYVSQGKWPEAETYADRALEQNADFIPALQAKVVSLRATDHKIDAFKVSEKLNGLLPENPVRLWQHAQLAHEAGEYEKEITALTKLISMAEAEERPTGEYHFYLGEAHAFQSAKDGTHVPMALEHLKRALLDPSLPAKQRKFALERLATIRERTGLK